MTAHILTQAELKEKLHYCPLTGLFTRLITIRKHKAGDIAGGFNRQGYWRIRIDGNHYLSHRLAWMYVNGSWPNGEIDHINGNRSDNRIVNLREATRTQNMRNTLAPSNNFSGYKGVYFYKSRNKWRAKCNVGGKYRHIGYFPTAKLASDAYEAYAKLAFGEFYREPINT